MKGSRNRPQGRSGQDGYLAADETSQTTETFLRGHKMKHQKKSWMQDVANIIRELPGRTFSLDDVYKHKSALRRRHPGNHHIKAKVRQCVQKLRDKKIVDHVRPGTYRKKAGGLS